MDSGSLSTGEAVCTETDVNKLPPVPVKNKTSRPGVTENHVQMYVHPMQRSLSLEEASFLLFNSDCVTPFGKSAGAELCAISQESNLVAWRAVSCGGEVADESILAEAMDGDPPGNGAEKPASSNEAEAEAVSRNEDTGASLFSENCGELHQYKQRLLQVAVRQMQRKPLLSLLLFFVLMRLLKSLLCVIKSLQYTSCENCYSAAPWKRGIFSWRSRVSKGGVDSCVSPKPKAFRAKQHCVISTWTSDF